jgi:sulfate transport system permease protein
VRTPVPKARPRALPGFGLSLGLSLTYLSLIVLLPLAALVTKTAGMAPSEFWAVVSSPRALASYRVTVGAAALATLGTGLMAC